MLFISHLLLGALWASFARSQDITLTGSPKTASSASQSVPTGSYVSYTTTVTEPSGSAFTSTGSRSVSGGGSGLVESGSGVTTSTRGSRTIVEGTVPATPSNSASASASGGNSSTLVPPPNIQGCNLFPQFCNRTYSNITEVCAHNSMFDSPGDAASNQELPVTTQLNDGIRMLQGQTHTVNGTLRFCHTSCDILDAGPVVDYLTTVRQWVQSHPYDVVTILLANGDYDDVNSFTGPIRDSGLETYAYVPPKIPMGIQDWPTLGNMILQGKRVIFFMDYKADQSSVPYILDEFSQMWETPFDPTDDTFPCTVQRPPGQTDQEREQKLYLLNHNLNQDINLLGASLSVPNTVAMNVTNNVTGPGSLGFTTSGCTSLYNRPPKFLLVDYYNRDNGTVFQVAANHNNVTYDRPCCGLPTSAASQGQHRLLPSAILVALVSALAIVAF
ncbi:MAG: hypothetical protein M4579_004584 [Chaenotheca gracillima]|nr:MAG: hypothetical protein M4579_004584 [Chaenotheca gracillima]